MNTSKGWLETKWGALATVEYGKSLRDYDEIPSERKPIRVFGTNGPIGWHSSPLCPSPGIVVGRKGAFRGIHFSPKPFFVIDTAFYLKPKVDFDIRWAYYQLKDFDINRLDSGSAIPSTSRDAFYEIPVSLPPYPVQRSIANILSAYDDLIENCQQRIKILEEMARSLYREWFVHFRFSRRRSAKRVTSPLGFIPQGWEVKSLGEVATITMGLSPKGDTYNDEEDGTPLVNGPVEFGDRFAKRVKWTTAPTKFCKEGDLIVCVRGSTTGKYVKSDGVYCLGRGVCAISSSQYQCFVDLLFANELPTLLGQTSGSTFPSWTGPQLKSHPVLSPPAELLARFETMVQPMSAAVLRHSRKIQNLRRTRDLLLPRLICGQVRV